MIIEDIDLDLVHHQVKTLKKDQNLNHTLEYSKIFTDPQSAHI